MPDNGISIPEAIQVFVHGFAATKSLYSPYEAVEVEGTWVMRDAVKRKVARKCEVISFASPLSNARKVAREHCSDRWFLGAIAIPDDEDQVYREGRAEGFRLLAREGFFVLDPRKAVLSDGSAERVRDREILEAVRSESRSRVMFDERFGEDDAPIRLFAVLDAGKPVGWVSSIRVGSKAWVSNLYVREEHRGKGFGRSLMSALLADDARLGIEHSVLLASSAGSRLYPHLGYERIGTLLLFAPIRSR